MVQNVSKHRIIFMVDFSILSAHFTTDYIISFYGQIQKLMLNGLKTVNTALNKIKSINQ